MSNLENLRRILKEGDGGVATSSDAGLFTPTHGGGGARPKKKRKGDKEQTITQFVKGLVESIQVTKGLNLREIARNIGMPIDQFDYEEVSVGFCDEQNEHVFDAETQVIGSTDWESVLKIVWAHLKEDPHYYSKILPVLNKEDINILKRKLEIELYKTLKESVESGDIPLQKSLQNWREHSEVSYRNTLDSLLYRQLCTKQSMPDQRPVSLPETALRKISSMREQFYKDLDDIKEELLTKEGNFKVEEYRLTIQKNLNTILESIVDVEEIKGDK